MFSKRSDAIQVVESMLSINTLLNYSVFRLNETDCPKSEKTEYARNVGNIMGIAFDVLTDVWSKYPDLKPSEFRESSKEND